MLFDNIYSATEITDVCKKKRERTIIYYAHTNVPLIEITVMCNNKKSVVNFFVYENKEKDSG